ncbi:MAG: hypothetical protein F6K26_03275 [Moorea sp. SIO2I5]|nr:hypothetical protein [Moorena sp. SIO2I5]
MLLALRDSNSCITPTLWSELAHTLISLKPHKSLYFQRGLKALSQLQQELEPSSHP